LISKYELTQGQWMRLTGMNPSTFPVHSVSESGLVSLCDPVEAVSWDDSMRVLVWVGLTLPTEAQWETACRGGTDTPWWMGSSVDSLAGRINFGDGAFERGVRPVNEVDAIAAKEDGYVFHAPVGSLPPNPFGLYEVHGNVAEWCRDEYGAYSFPVRPGDGERMVALTVTRVQRGGSYGNSILKSRSAARQHQAAGDHPSFVGVRPAMPLPSSNK
jgi:formylglycine-generating enzyme required for sulfatase activity